LYVVEAPNKDSPQAPKVHSLMKRTKSLLRRNKRKPLVRGTAAALIVTLLFSTLSPSTMRRSGCVFAETLAATSLILVLFARIQEARLARSYASSRAPKQKHRRMIRGPSTVRPVPTRGAFRKQRRPSKRTLFSKAEKECQRGLVTAAILTRQASSSRLLASP